MKAKLLKRIRKEFLIKHTEKGTAVILKDFSYACLISDKLSWLIFLKIYMCMNCEFLERNRRIRTNKRIFKTLQK